MPLRLEEVLQRLYDSEVNVTITTLWDDGYNFALISYMEWEEAGRPIDYMKSFISVEPRERPDRHDPWHRVERADQLAEAIHDAALGKYPESTYAKLYGPKDRATMSPVEWHRFPEGEEGPNILTGVSSFCNEGEHDECPGHAKSEEYGGRTVFCICPCHEEPHKA